MAKVKIEEAVATGDQMPVVDLGADALMEANELPLGDYDGVIAWAGPKQTKDGEKWMLNTKIQIESEVGHGVNVWHRFIVLFADGRPPNDNMKRNIKELITLGVYDRGEAFNGQAICQALKNKSVQFEIYEQDEDWGPQIRKLKLREDALPI